MNRAATVLPSVRSRCGAKVNANWKVGKCNPHFARVVLAITSLTTPITLSQWSRQRQVRLRIRDLPPIDSTRQRTTRQIQIHSATLPHLSRSSSRCRCIATTARKRAVTGGESIAVTNNVHAPVLPHRPVVQESGLRFYAQDRLMCRWMPRSWLQFGEKHWEPASL